MYSNSIDDDDGDTSDSVSIISNKFKTEQIACAICGAKPTGINFDVLTCSSCKAFFRRNGVKPLNQFSCRSNGECKVDQRSRRQCTACRLRKCFAVGMIKERIRTDEQNQRHRALVEENRRQKLKKYRQQQQENQLKIFEERRQQVICSTSSSLSSCLLSNNHFDDVDLFLDLYVDSTHKLLPEDFHFKFDDNLTNVLNCYCLPISSLISFLKQLFQFQQLPIDDRLLLLKNNVKILLPILTHLLNRTLGIPIVINHPGSYAINNKIRYAYSLFADIMPDDNRLSTLIILVFLFCPCLFTSKSLHDAGYISEHSRQLIRCTYNQYTQALWYYVMEKSLHNEQQAILTYMKIVTKFLHLQNVMSEVYGIVECSVQIDRLHMIMQSILHLT